MLMLYSPSVQIKTFLSPAGEVTQLVNCHSKLPREMNAQSPQFVMLKFAYKHTRLQSAMYRKITLLSNNCRSVAHQSSILHLGPESNKDNTISITSEKINNIKLTALLLNTMTCPIYVTFASLTGSQFIFDIFC